MYFEAADADVFEAVRRDLYELSSNLSVTPFGLRSAPTHTEDGIPIRKLYVSNLPSKTTRSELFGVFAQYGFIKSCWLRMGEKGPNRSPIPTYAFVTFSNPEDAHKALQAPCNEKVLRGRTLRTSPADSWHQPAVDPDGRVRWRPNGYRRDNLNMDSDFQNLMSLVSSSEAGGTSASEILDHAAAAALADAAAAADVADTNEEDNDKEQSYNVLDILNRDCWKHILDYVPVRDIIRSERVSKGWQNMIQEYIDGIRTFKTSWWQPVPVTLTTAVLRRVLQRLGASLLRLHIDHHRSTLNDRTAHCVGKFCPNLEEIKVVGMHTKNWNPLIYGCKELKKLSFISCNKLTDSSLVQLVKNESCIESLGVSNNTHVTGLFLTGATHLALRSLSFYNCYSLQGTVLSAAIDTLPNLTCLKLDMCPVSMWKIVPLILSKLPKLEELSLSEYTSFEIFKSPQGNEAFCEALANLTELKVLNLSRNIHITNAVLKQVAQSCPNLESLNVSSCNARKNLQAPGGVSDEGVSAVCSGCAGLRALDLSYLAALTDAGLAAVARLRRLAVLTVRGNGAVTERPLVAALLNCHELREVDACGCDNVTGEVALAAARALQERPRALALHLAGTAAAAAADLDGDDPLPRQWELPKHKMLALNVHIDRSNPHLRPDFVDHIFEDSSDESLEDLYEHPIFEDFMDDELYLDDEDREDLEAAFPYAIEYPNFIIL